jgi:hypothetical protein
MKRWTVPYLSLTEILTLYRSAGRLVLTDRSSNPGVAPRGIWPRACVPEARVAVVATGPHSDASGALGPYSA